MTPLALGRKQCSNFEQAISREWLVTNGIGGFACGTICDTNTRRYHGLLIAALAPPLARTLLVASLDVMVRYGSMLRSMHTSKLGSRRIPLSTHEYGDATIDPAGYLQLESFHLDNGLPVWRYAFSDALLEKRILMKPGENTSYVSIKVIRASTPLELEIVPLCTYRGYHSHTHGGWDMNYHEIDHGIQINAYDSTPPYQITCHGADFIPQNEWYWNFKHRCETLRGLDDSEDLFCPGHFSLTLEADEQSEIIISTKYTQDQPTDEPTFKQTNECIKKQQNKRLEQVPDHAPDWVLQLALAADQFIVDRYQDGKPTGKTVIAGYPWFNDWGRDTMIALPGLTLTTKRFDIAASILQTFAAVVDQGMLPNRFPDHAETPEYNTVDATLWYFHALDQYLKHSGDVSIAKELYPVLTDIIDWHQRGTRYGIKVDPEDGLLSAGEAGVQLTWMDAKVGDWVVTPRRGKAVEINALWYNALCVMDTLSTRLDKKMQALQYREAASQLKASFQRFWNTSRDCLHDVIDGPEGEPGEDGKCYDKRLRPNQIFAVSLPHSPLNPAQQKSIVDICARELLTSHGLRTLARNEPGYVAHYQGGPQERDGAYHQGTVWAWLIGPFVDAHYRVYQDTAIARSFLEPLGLHLTDACVGSISEIFDAEPPFTPRGCIAQAWSVAELLRAWFVCDNPPPK